MCGLLEVPLEDRSWRARRDTLRVINLKDLVREERSLVLAVDVRESRARNVVGSCSG